MPAESQAQYRLFQKVRHDPRFAKRKGISKQVADEFVTATPNPAALPKHQKSPKRRGR